MDLATIIGMILGFGLVGFSIVSSAKENVPVFISPASAMTDRHVVGLIDPKPSSAGHYV